MGTRQVKAAEIDATPQDVVALALRVKREVHNKLTSGLKNPRAKSVR